MRECSQPGSADNRLLAALSGPVGERVRRYLRLVELPLGKAVHEPGTARRDVYFLVSCVFSKQYVTTAGDAAEVASVGNEGLVELPLLFGCTRAPIRTVVQVAGRAWRGDHVPLQHEFVRNLAWQSLVLRFTEALMTQMGQNAVSINTTASNSSSACGCC